MLTLTTPPAEIPADQLLTAYRDHRAARLAIVMECQGFTRDEQRAYINRCRDFESAFFEAAKQPGCEYLAAWGIDARSEAQAKQKQLLRED